MPPRKGPLPTKLCPDCHRPITSRNKGERRWEEVKYCSEGCKRKGGASSRPKSK
ncbi:MAG: DUF2256 domain-containing protein [Planctomycetaceae bacterium]